MRFGPSRIRKLLFGVAIVAAALFLIRATWLPALAAPLIHDDGPAKADIAVVLAGDRWGRRILKGAEMVEKGYVPTVLVSGPCGDYGICESDPAIAFAVRQGCRQQWFIPLPHWGLSTREEADVMIGEMKARSIRSFLLVTSDYHTARSARIYRKVAHDMGFHASMRVVAAPDQFFRRESWWRDREAQKAFFFEWSKTIATLFGM